MPVTQKNSARKVGMRSNIDLENTIEVVIAIPSYNENASLPLLIQALSPTLSAKDAVLILDDSSNEVFAATKLAVVAAFKNSEGFLIFSHYRGKSGRGAAVRRGMKLSFEHYSKFKYFIECDADGSHRVEDIVKLKDSQSNCDLLIGSRYLAESEIKGWPLQRKIFSKILNIVIPFVLRIPVKDITNGLRRYSPEAIKQILSLEPINKGFTYLSEQAFIVQSKRLTICETPIVFANRVAGSSTVTWNEVLVSIKGIMSLIFLKKRLRIND
jgi:dolichol-phosphate mannosyltransferase